MTSIGVSVGAVDVYDAVADAVEGADVRHVVQVAGGSGTLLAAILRRLPDATGVLFDRPEVVAEAGPTLYAAGVAERVDCMPGHLMHDVPPGGDLYVVARALTGWADDHALQLFRRCREVMASSARLVLAEPTRPPARRCNEWRDLLSAAQFSPRCVTGTAHQWCVIEAVPTD
ncbi:MAG: hypothetical protein QOK28_550 [Actinomycetota bacterium]|jgi:hypothetical protein